MMAKQTRKSPPPSKTGIFGWTVRAFLYLVALAVMTVAAYYIALYGVKKRDEMTQRQLLEAYQHPPSLSSASPQGQDYPLNAPVYDLSLLWDESGGKPIIVNIAHPTIWQYYVVQVMAVLSSPHVKEEIENPQTALQLQDLLMNTIAAQKVEEVSLPSGKAKLKEEIRDGMNAILGEKKIVAVYFKLFFYQ